jgi:hypothetical protein
MPTLVAQMTSDLHWLKPALLITGVGLTLGIIALWLRHTCAGRALAFVAIGIGIVAPPIFVVLTHGALTVFAYIIYATPAVPALIGLIMPRARSSKQQSGFEIATK